MLQNDSQPKIWFSGITSCNRDDESKVTLWPSVSSGEEWKLPLLRSRGFQRFASHRLSLGKWEAGDTILNLTPAADIQRASEIAELNLTSTVVATVDHFAQVETINRAAECVGTSVRVLVAVNSGANFYGCRPGTEAVHLALGVDLQSHLTFHGITTELPAKCEAADRPSSDSSIAALSETERKLKQCNLSCAIMHLTGNSNIQHLRVPDYWHLSLPAGEPGGELVQHQIDFVGRETDREINVTATVISRPSLELAVLDCGTGLIGEAFGLHLQNHARLPIVQIDEHRCVVDLTNSSSDLMIGQKVGVLSAMGEAN